MQKISNQNVKTVAEEIREQLSEFTLFDDDFMREFFQDDIECTELLIQIILEKPDLKVKSIDVQHDIKNYGHRDVTLDILATDSENKLYDIEVQRSNHGAIPKRARFHSSILDSKLLDSKEDFSKLPEIYIIFITENDVLKKGFALYHIDRMIRETKDFFNDESHIIYVNGAFEGEDPIGLLMHDFKCKKAKDMKYEKLAEKMKYYKEDEEGGKKMCDKLKAIWDRHETELMEKVRIAEKRENELKVKMATTLLQNTNLSLEDIAVKSELKIEDIKKLAEVLKI